MSRVRRGIAIVGSVLMIMSIGAPVGANGPVRPTSGDEPQDVVAPTGGICDVQVSTLDGPLVDGIFSIRAYEAFIVWGFDYPASTEVIVAFSTANVREEYRITADPDGTFADVFFFYPTGKPQVLWTVAAYVEINDCDDDHTIRVLPPHPFSDAINHAFELEISWLFREEITGGCTSTRFCPASGVTRGQMAAFLTRALHLPTTTADFFDDDDGTTFEHDINRLAHAGITPEAAQHADSARTPW